jgi:acetaldehyde dehydrogenase (acetylating)
LSPIFFTEPLLSQMLFTPEFGDIDVTVDHTSTFSHVIEP